MGLVKHGATRIGKDRTLYKRWEGMKKRCYNRNYEYFEYYGGRGIIVCRAWQEFEGFRAWAKKSRFRRHLTLDRKNPNGNYTPSNCRWVTRKQQANNRRKRRWWKRPA